jgi:hypothetical protein
MRSTKPATRARLARLALLPALALAPPAAASDGVVEINAARVSAGGITAGDAPGFPATLSAPGSYRLTDSLIVTNADLRLIEITSGDVSLDLNGFSLSVYCEQRPCGGTQGGIGIDANGQANIRVSNGTVEEFSSRGIVAGARARIERVRVLGTGNAIAPFSEPGIETGDDGLVSLCTANSNDDTGIRVGAHSRVEYSEARLNAVSGIVAGSGSTLVGNRVSANGTLGIQAGNAVIADNAASGNALIGIQCQNQCTVTSNASWINGGSGISLDGGSTASGNAVNQNQSVGIFGVTGNLATGNTVRNNVSFGIQFTGSDNGYAHNVLTGNNAGGADPEIQVSGGTQLPAGSNFCGANTTCP